LPINLTLVVIVSGLLHAKEPLVVTIPAVKGLVLRREALVTWSGTHVLNLVQEILLLLAELGDLVAENLQFDRGEGQGSGERQANECEK
jgi:hypothetical protein